METADQRLKGVKGWLLLLCLNLVIFDPGAVLFNLFSAAGSMAADFDKDPELLKLVLISGVLRIALMVFSLYAGLSLWKVVPGAVTTARRYLICLFSFAVFSLFLPQIVDLKEEAYPGFSTANELNVAVTMLHVGAWYLYLGMSKRVKATYQEIPQAEEE